MEQQVLLQLVKSVKAGAADEVFPVILETYGEQAAAAVISIILEQDEATFSF